MDSDTSSGLATQPATVKPRPCVVIDGDDRWFGSVLHRYREQREWRAVVRYTRWTAEGWPMTHEMGLPASRLEPHLTVS